MPSLPRHATPLSPLSRAQRLCVRSHPGLCSFAEWAGGDARLHCAGAFPSCLQFCLLVEASLLQQAYGKQVDISVTPPVSPPKGSDGNRL